MMRRSILRTIISIFFLVLVLLILLYIGEKYLLKMFMKNPTDQALQVKRIKEQEGFDKLSFHLVDPEMAPAPLKKEVMFGFDLMTNTTDLLPTYAGDSITCTNCHFAAGNTTGGKNNGLSLVGVAANYPTYNASMGQVIDLATRINSCFEKSLNGRPLPPESREMIALITYLTWISKHFPIYARVPWRGLTPLKTEIKADPNKGKEVFSTYCASCHGQNGEGQNDQTLIIPPLWGNKSFNRAAGMANIKTLASFIYLNMPYDKAELTEEQALHVARFILDQPRPEFEIP